MKSIPDNHQGERDNSLSVLDSLRSYYNSRANSETNGFDIFSLPDSLLFYLISLFHGDPLPPPDLADEEWKHFISIISAHWIGPLLFYLLENISSSDKIPKHVYHYLNESFISSHKRSLHTEVQIRSLSQICSDAEIEFLVIKGPALGHCVYPHPALRTGSDIDILVKEEQIADLIATLKKSWYLVRFDSFSRSKNLFHHVIFFPQTYHSNNLRLPVEVHWRPLVLTGSGGKVTISSLLSTATEISTGLVTFKMLHPADAFVYAASHMCIFHAGMLRLIWVADIAYLMKEITRTNSWDLVISSCRKWESTLACREALIQAALWFGVTPPSPYDSITVWPEPSENEKQVFYHLKRRKKGFEIHLNEQFKEMPTLREKFLAVYYFLFRTDTIQLEFPNLSWWEYPECWLHLVRGELRKNR